jgi:hypothetical protein
VIAERQEAIDGDTEEVAIIEDYFEQQLRKLGYDTESDSVHVPNRIAAQWFAEATNERCTTTSMTRSVKQYATEGTFRYLEVNPGRTHGRGLRWYAGGEVRSDLEDRIEDDKQRDRRGF